MCPNTFLFPWVPKSFCSELSCLQHLKPYSLLICSLQIHSRMCFLSMYAHAEDTDRGHTCLIHRCIPGAWHSAWLRMGSHKYFTGAHEDCPSLKLKVFPIDSKPPLATTAPFLHKLLQDKVSTVCTAGCPSTIWTRTGSTDMAFEMAPIGSPTSSGCETHRGLLSS